MSFLEKKRKELATADAQKRSSDDDAQGYSKDDTPQGYDALEWNATTVCHFLNYFQSVHLPCCTVTIFLSATLPSPVLSDV